MPLATPSTTSGTMTGSGPSAQPMPMRMSETPMTRMIVPVTTGGNSRIRLPIRGATRKAKTPAAMTAP